MLPALGRLRFGYLRVKQRNASRDPTRSAMPDSTALRTPIISRARLWIWAL